MLKQALPWELVENFGRAKPLRVGGLGQVWERVAHELRFKRHRWFPADLKTRGTLHLSAGWRAFSQYLSTAQKIKISACAPSSTRRTTCTAKPSFGDRWSRPTPVSLLSNHWLKTKRDGELVRQASIHRHTAFVGGMFNSQLEVSKFEGASIRTVSGIRGIIKKALRPGVHGGKDGSFRATFEDKPLMSDIIFLRAWVGLDLPRFYNPVTNLLAPAALESRAPKPPSRDAPQAENSEAGVAVADSGTLEEAPEHAPDLAGTGGAWVGMKTVAQLRRELGVGAPRNPNSLYKPIERVPRQFNPLKIPKGLQAALPFKSKPKDKAKQVRKTLEQRRAVVQGPQERKAVSLVQQLSAIRNQREVKRKQAQQKRNEGLQKRKSQEAEWRKDFNQQERKRRYVEQGKAEKFKRQRQEARPSFDMPS
ncbi:hypothetical protein WJX84_006856 [Apatococcus fuscideae]|uniref:Ribosome biogenesis protein BMS1/TSR1 C-terminal domain-containing protein n=1 Tax=Apatococcus fuscideae TaxID=2026836 RepID=A0AAW1TBH3_9CHLO